MAWDQHKQEETCTSSQHTQPAAAAAAVGPLLNGELVEFQLSPVLRRGFEKGVGQQVILTERRARGGFLRTLRNVKLLSFLSWARGRSGDSCVLQASTNNNE